MFEVKQKVKIKQLTFNFITYIKIYLSLIKLKSTCLYKSGSRS